MAILTAAVCILAVLVLFNLLLSFGLVRRMRLASGDGGVVSGPPAGTSVAPFSATTLDGVSISERDLSAGSFIVGFFQTGCAPCVDLKNQLLAQGSPEPLAAFVEGEADDPASLEIAQELAVIACRVAIVEHESSATAAFKVTAYPTLVRLNDGVVQAKGHRLRSIGLAEPARLTA